MNAAELFEEAHRLIAKSAKLQSQLNELQAIRGRIERGEVRADALDRRQIDDAIEGLGKALSGVTESMREVTMELRIHSCIERQLAETTITLEATLFPRHEWDGTKLRFEKAPGEWGEWVDLRGPRGYAGASIGAVLPKVIGGGGALDDLASFDGGGAAGPTSEFTLGGGGAADFAPTITINGGRAH